MPGRRTLLGRPGDKDSPNEEAAVEKLSRGAKRAYDDAIFRLKNSVARIVRYEALGAFGDILLERKIQDRILGELLEAKPSLRVTLPEWYFNDLDAAVLTRKTKAKNG